NPGHAPCGAPSPSLGDGKRAEDGRIPAPKQTNRGQRTIASGLSAVVPAERSEAGTHNHRTIDGTRSMGPRFRGDDNREAGVLSLEGPPSVPAKGASRGPRKGRHLQSPLR